MATAVKKHPGRKRRIGGWALVLMALVVVAVWVASGWWRIEYWSPGRVWVVAGGTASYGDFSAFPPLPVHTGWRMRRAQRNGPAWAWHAPAVPLGATGTQWFLFCRLQNSIETDTSVVFWPLPLLLTAIGVPVLMWGVRARRRARVGACLACGYDRRGLAPGAVCPECGKV